MDALNKAFEKALSHDKADNNLTDLLACLGEELSCDRICIFEENEDHRFDNTYEWCKKGVQWEQMLLQNLTVRTFEIWRQQLHDQETLVFASDEDMQEADPDVCRFFKEHQICSAMVTSLGFHGTKFGFCILENPSAAVLADSRLVMPGIRYILSSMIYNRNLVERLRRLSYIDALTGAGNRISMQETLRSMDPESPFSIICLDVIGWDNPAGKIPNLEQEQTLVRSGEILTNLFDDDHVFRISTGEFLILGLDLNSKTFAENVYTLRSLFRENNLLIALSGEWYERKQDSIDRCLHEIHKKAEEEKRLLMLHRRKHLLREAEEKTLENDKDVNSEKAVIDLPRNSRFFRQAEQFLGECYTESVIFIVIDINYFNLYNDIFGRKAGNLFLENIARFIRQIAEEHRGIGGYLGGDNFSLLLPSKNNDYHEVIPAIEDLYHNVKFPDGFSPAMGVYFSTDRRETAITMYDRALTALSEIKGDYMRHIQYYSMEAHHHQKEDRLMMMHVREGLEKGEFIFYVQPQVNVRNGKIIGGEALVRWQRDGQVIPPGRFIPLLEKTGYIFTVDNYIWDRAARWQRSLIDRGIRPLPVSVNVSRVDFYFGDIAQIFINLVKTYDLDPSLIGIEITESSFTDNLDLLLNAVRRLHDAGFHILMDDFGSGSSSLSMLHTMHLDVLKTDVQFMSKDNQDHRAISIVESVISMAHLIGMAVITEGVETENQRENLIALGENYAQGYCFYRPMPKEQFEELIRVPSNVTESYSTSAITQASKLKFRDMIKEGLVSDTLLERIIRASAIYKEQNGKITIVQWNSLYAEMTGITPDPLEPRAFEDHFDDPNLEIFRQLLKKADRHPYGGSEGSFCFRRTDGEVISMEIRMFLLYTFGNHKLYLSTMR